MCFPAEAFGRMGLSPRLHSGLSPETRNFSALPVPWSRRRYDDGRRRKRRIFGDGARVGLGVPGLVIGGCDAVAARARIDLFASVGRRAPGCREIMRRP